MLGLPSQGDSLLYGLKMLMFPEWYGFWSKQAGLSPDPDDPRHNYDFRQAYAQGLEPKWNEQLGQYKWPSVAKTEGHPNKVIRMFQGLMDTTTGKRVE